MNNQGNVTNNQQLNTLNGMAQMTGTANGNVVNNVNTFPQMQNASDGWILYDRKYYTDEPFKSLSEEIQNLTEIE